MTTIPTTELAEKTALAIEPRYRGIVPPLITPLKGRDQLDKSGLSRMLEHVISGGVSGVFILGTTGEAPSLSYRLRREMITETVQIVGGRVPVFVGVADTAFVESVQLAEYAADCKADAAVLTTPFYFPVGQSELTKYIQNIVPEIPLPVMLYNMPGLTKVWYEIETLSTLTSMRSIIGVKDSSGDLNYFGRLCQLKKLRPDWSIFMGPEAMLPDAMALGADGGVTGGANVLPRLFVDCYQALSDGDHDQTQSCMKVISQFQSIYEIGKYASRHIKATKCAVSLLGLCQDQLADPFDVFLPHDRQRVAQILQAIGVLKT